MFGSREEFTYFQCSSCGCLQIETIPEDLHRHYPSDYYSQQTTPMTEVRRSIRSIVIRHYSRTIALNPKSLYAELLRKALPTPIDFLEIGEYLIKARLMTSDERILDVGCGASPKRLAAMRRCGFLNVLGIDPFINADSTYCGVDVKKCRLEDLTGQFGLIMYHHSLEHVPDPLASLSAAASLLRPNGLCLVRIPVMDTFFWREFGCNWAELDAPRHLYLMATKTIELLCAKTGFLLEGATFDSSGWEIAASELYQRDESMFERTSTGLHNNLTQFSKNENDRFDSIAATLNKSSDGGRACFYLRRNA